MREAMRRGDFLDSCAVQEALVDSKALQVVYVKDKGRD